VVADNFPRDVAPRLTELDELCPEMDYLTHYQQAVSRQHPGCILNSLARFQCGD
jgi:hypothetical protein